MANDAEKAKCFSKVAEIGARIGNEMLVQKATDSVKKFGLEKEFLKESLITSSQQPPLDLTQSPKTNKTITA